MATSLLYCRVLLLVRCPEGPWPTDPSWQRGMFRGGMGQISISAASVGAPVLGLVHKDSYPVMKQIYASKRVAWQSRSIGA